MRTLTRHFPQSDITVLSTNAKASAGRAAEWASKRVFFCTPQVCERVVIPMSCYRGPLSQVVTQHPLPRDGNE